MAIIDTTNVIDNSIFLKSKLKKNMVSDNYYIENLQHKRDLDWEYRYNRVEIEEELSKQIRYTNQIPCYTPIEAVITNVKSDTGEDLGIDWAHIAFKSLKHRCDVGMRYRFSLDFPDLSAMTEEDKKYTTSIWLCINRSPITAGNSCTVRRCNTALTLLGSNDGTLANVTEIHQEPCILENEMKYMQVYYNQTLPIPQSEWYVTMQCNYFSNSIKINDRFVLGVLNPCDRENNTVYKVKSVFKSNTRHTFVSDDVDEMENTSLVILGLDKDLISPDDDFVNRIASQAPIYKVVNILPHDIPGMTDDGVWNIDFIPFASDYKKSFYTVRMGKGPKEYKTGLYKNGILNDTPVEFCYEYFLEGLDKSCYNKYFSHSEKDNSFTIVCNNNYEDGDLLVVISCIVPNTEEKLTKTYRFKLKGLG